MAALDQQHTRDDPDAAIYDERPIEVRTAHNPEETILAVERATRGRDTPPASGGGIDD